MCGLAFVGSAAELGFSGTRPRMGNKIKRFGEKGGYGDEWDKWDGWDEKREGRFSMEVEGWREEKCDFEDK